MELQHDDGWWQVTEALTPHTRLSTGHAQRVPPFMLDARGGKTDRHTHRHTHRDRHTEKVERY